MQAMSQMLCGKLFDNRHGTPFRLSGRGCVEH